MIMEIMELQPIARKKVLIVSRRSCLRFVNILVLLPAFQALAGCNTTSGFAGRGKRTARSAWSKFKDVTPLYLHLPKH